jgi:protein TonB
VKTWALTTSALIHATAFGLFSLLAYQKAEFGIRAGNSAVEVELVAAPAPSEPQTEQNLDLPDVPPLLPSEEEAMIAPPSEPPPPAARPALPPRPFPVLRTPAPPRIGDGSSPVPGLDATTRRAEGGALDGQARPNYLRNPPPPYPEQARRLQQEGLVKLRVQVTADGRASSVQIESSSGWPILDEAALRAVKNWRFHPARVGGIPIPSTVTVPIRFELHAAPR